jgi:hypothetical protein
LKLISTGLSSEISEEYRVPVVDTMGVRGRKMSGGLEDRSGGAMPPGSVTRFFVLQPDHGGHECDKVWTMNLDGSDK